MEKIKNIRNAEIILVRLKSVRAHVTRLCTKRKSINTITVHISRIFVHQRMTVISTSSRRLHFVAKIFERKKYVQIIRLIYFTLA